MSIGKKLQKIRKMCSLTQEELAKKLGASKQDVAKWELDEEVPGVDKLAALSMYLNISLDNLINGLYSGENTNSNSAEDTLSETM